jgi:hypothetical protein
MEVRNTQGEQQGEIEDLIVDVNDRRVHYAILSFGGIMGPETNVARIRCGPSGDAGRRPRWCSTLSLKAAFGFDCGWIGTNRSTAPNDRCFGDIVQVEPQLGRTEPGEEQAESRRADGVMCNRFD